MRGRIILLVLGVLLILLVGFTILPLERFPAFLSDNQSVVDLKRRIDDALGSLTQSDDRGELTNGGDSAAAPQTKTPTPTPTQAAANESEATPTSTIDIRRATPTPTPTQMPGGSPLPTATAIEPVATSTPTASPECDGQGTMRLFVEDSPETTSRRIYGHIIEECRDRFQLDDRVLGGAVYFTITAHDANSDEMIGAVMDYYQRDHYGVRSGDEPTGEYMVNDQGFSVGLRYGAFTNGHPYRLRIWAWRAGDVNIRVNLGWVDMPN